MVDFDCLGSIGVDRRYGPESSQFRFGVNAGVKHHSASAFDSARRSTFWWGGSSGEHYVTAAFDVAGRATELGGRIAAAF